MAEISSWLSILVVVGATAAFFYLWYCLTLKD